jgi:hypothetical protein
MDSPINSPTLGYVNKNQDLHYIELDSFEACITLPEDLIFVSLREGTEHVFAPLTKFPFSNIERDIIGLKGSFDMSYLKDADYRKANSKFCPYDLPDVIQEPSFITIAFESPLVISIQKNLPASVQYMVLQERLDGEQDWSTVSNPTLQETTAQLYRYAQGKSIRVCDPDENVISNVLYLGPSN